MLCGALDLWWKVAPQWPNSKVHLGLLCCLVSCQEEVPQWKEEPKPLWIGTYFPPCRKKKKSCLFLGLTSWIIWTSSCHIQRKCFLNSCLDYSLPYHHLQCFPCLSNLRGELVSSVSGSTSSDPAIPSSQPRIFPQQTYVDSWMSEPPFVAQIQGPRSIPKGCLFRPICHE